MNNNLIKDLIEQATTEEPDGFRYFDKKKFAELIINDCASLCEIEGRSYKYSFTPMKAQLAESTANHCAHIIKRHFGVEE